MNYGITWLLLLVLNLALQAGMEAGFRLHIKTLDVSTVMIMGFVGLGLSALALLTHQFLLALKKENWSVFIVIIMFIHLVAFAHSAWILYHFVPQFFLNQ